MLAKEDREYVLQETAAISAELRVIYTILDNIALRMDCIEDFAVQRDKSTCKCGSYDASYRMD